MRGEKRRRRNLEIYGTNTGGLVGPQLKELVPRLFPFLSHSSIPVRLACLETLLILSKSKVRRANKMFYELKIILQKERYNIFSN